MLTNVQPIATPNIYLKKIQMPDSYSIKEVCPHDIAEIKVLESVVTCETTQLVCAQCGEALEPPKTEC